MLTSGPPTDQKNIFGTAVKVVEMQSEAGAAGTVHGSLGTGALTTTYTASQGLLLMIPNMYKIAGEQLPCRVPCFRAYRFHPRAEHLRRPFRRVWPAARPALPCSAEGNVQEVMDLGPVAHLAALNGTCPLHQLLRRLPHQPRDPEDRGLGL